MNRLILALMIGLAGTAQAKTKASYPPETWVMTVSFNNFPHHIACREENGRGTVKETRVGRNVSYKITGFPQADRLICDVSTGKSFAVNMAFLFGQGRTKREMGGAYLAGEIKSIDLKVRYQSNAVGYGNYKAHVFLKTYRGRKKIIYAADDMFAAFFPRRASQPKKRWKP